MKKITYIITFLLATLISYQCSESNFLDIQPQNQLSDADFWKTEDDFLSAINGVYNSYAQYGTASFSMNTVANTPSGDLHWNVLGDLNKLETLDLVASNGETGNAYSSINYSITQANTLLARI